MEELGTLKRTIECSLLYTSDCVYTRLCILQGHQPGKKSLTKSCPCTAWKVWGQCSHCTQLSSELLANNKHLKSELHCLLYLAGLSCCFYQEQNKRQDETRVTGIVSNWDASFLSECQKLCKWIVGCGNNVQQLWLPTWLAQQQPIKVFEIDRFPLSSLFIHTQAMHWLERRKEATMRVLEYENMARCRSYNSAN